MIVGARANIGTIRAQLQHTWIERLPVVYATNACHSLHGAILFRAIRLFLHKGNPLRPNVVKKLRKERCEERPSGNSFEGKQLK